MLDYDYFKNYRLIVDLNWQEVLDADAKAIQQIEFIGKLGVQGFEIVANQSMFVLTIFVCLSKLKKQD